MKYSVIFKRNALAVSLAVSSSVLIEAAAAGAVLEEVVVTARKRTESLQDVPISITAMGENDLERLGAVSLKDLKHAVPSFHYSDRSSLQTEITIRGVGGDARSIGLESGVGVYIDGVYAGRTSAYNMDLADIEQVEVLRGPQGTLFGKNTTGGAINIVTKKPTEEFEANAQLDLGNYNAVRFKGSVSGGLSEQLFGKLTIATWDRDGYLDNLFDGSELQSEERRAARLQLRYLPTDSLDINFSADVTTDDQDTILNQLGSPAAYGAPFYMNDRFKVNVDAPNTAERDMYGAALTVDYSFDSGHVLTSITSSRDVDVEVFSDVDSTPLDRTRSGPFTEEGAQFTQELRLVSPGDEFIDYVAGIYYYKQDSDALRKIYAEGVPVFLTEGPVDTEALAAYVNANINVSDSLTLTTGLRITDEEKTGYYEQGSVLVPPFNKSFPELETSSSELSWTVAANYGITEDLSTYASASRGFKSGGFIVDPLATPAPLSADEITFDPEFVTTYEIGLKSEFANGLGRISAAYFFSDYKDRQVPRFETVTNEFGTFSSVITRNAGEAEIQGVELELSVFPTESLRVNGSLSYMDGEYTKFEDADAIGSDFSGNTTERTPRSSLFLGAEYRTSLAGGELVFTPNFSYVGETFLSADNREFNTEDGYTVLDARIGYEFQEGRYSIYLWGKNLNQTEYKEFARQFQGSDQVIWGAPRTYGIELNARL